MNNDRVQRFPGAISRPYSISKDQATMVVMNSSIFRFCSCAALVASAAGFIHRHSSPTFVSRLHIFDKLFEEEGVLGKGITVGKVQVALNSPDRSANSIYGLLERKAANAGESPQELARLANDVCLTLMRKSDEWIAACSSSKWFSENDAGKAESYFNELANAEAVKYEKVGLVKELKACCSIFCVASSFGPTVLSGIHSRQFFR